MALPNSPQSYPDCYDFLEKAIDDTLGARKPFKTEEECRLFRLRCYRFRELTRQQNKTIYPLEDKRYGTSDYDELVLQIHGGADDWHWVYARRLTVGLDDVEPLSSVGEDHGDKTAS